MVHLQRNVSVYFSFEILSIRYLKTSHISLDYAGPEILRGERYAGPPQDIWAFGIVAYVLVVGECPFSTAQEAAVGLSSGCNALNALEDRCGMQPLPAGTVTTSPSSSPKSGGINIVGNLLDQTNFTAAPLMKACVQLDVAQRTTFMDIM